MREELLEQPEAPRAPARWWRLLVRVACLSWFGAAIFEVIEPPSRLPVIRVWHLGTFLGCMLAFAALAPIAWSRRLPMPAQRGFADERVRSSRAAAFQAGYWALLIAVAVLYGVSSFEPVRAPVALLVLMGVAIIVPSIRIVMLERRADPQA